MGYKITRKVKNDLKAVAAKLPQVNDISHERHILKGQEILNDGVLTELKGKTIEPEGIYEMKYPVKIAANHERRLKKAYIRAGVRGVQHYIDQLAKMAKQQKEKQNT